jgi:hypothetical protein
MKLLQMALVVLMLLFNLVSPLSAWADEAANISKYPDYLIGQKVVWLYKARADSNNVQRIPVEVVKLGSKQIQVRVRKQNNEFVNRWVNRDRLENL